jgi:hypothetical protein
MLVFQFNKIKKLTKKINSLTFVTIEIIKNPQLV